MEVFRSLIETKKETNCLCSLWIALKAPARPCTFAVPDRFLHLGLLWKPACFRPARVSDGACLLLVS